MGYNYAATIVMRGKGGPLIQLPTSDAGDGSNNRRYDIFIQDNYKTLILRIIIYNTNAITPCLKVRRARFSPCRGLSVRHLTRPSSSGQLRNEHLVGAPYMSDPQGGSGGDVGCFAVGAWYNRYNVCFYNIPPARRHDPYVGISTTIMT